MESGYLISLIILGVALIFLIGSGIYAMKKMKPTFKKYSKDTN